MEFYPSFSSKLYFMFYCQVVAEEVAGGSDEVFLQFRAEKLDKKVGDMVLPRR